MSEVFIIGVDLAKRVFQIHGANTTGKVIYRKKLSRPQFTKFLNGQARCSVAMEACASAHHWGRAAFATGHEVRLGPARHVKPFVKRHKSDTVDATICKTHADASSQKGGLKLLVLAVPKMA